MIILYGIHDVYEIANWLASQPTLIPWIPSIWIILGKVKTSELHNEKLL